MENLKDTLPKEGALEDAANEGRGTDTVLAHMSLGELVIPRAFLDDPEVMTALQKIFEAGGANMAEFTVGDPANKINPETGHPEFFFKGLKKIFKAAAPIALSYFAPGLGTAIGGALGAGASFAPIVGGAALGAGTSALTGGKALQGALLGGAGGALNSAVSGGFNDTSLGRGISDAYKTASGAFDLAGSGANDIYQGSTLQSAFKSGGDALKSIGIDTASSASAPAPAIGGGASSYGSQLPTAGVSPVASSKDYASPIFSAILGSRANSQAAKALMEQQRANEALLAPYIGGFSFTPGDLANDPGYQFNLAEGTKAADRAQLARGGYFSGNAAKELAEFNQGLADKTYNSAFNRALQSRNAGLTGALAGAGVNENIGNIKANAATNQGNLYSGALGALLGGRSFTNTGALQGGFDIQEFLRRNGIGESAYAG